MAEEAEQFASEARARTLALEPPPAESMFSHVYSEPHPMMDAQRQALADFEASFEGGAA